jgi:prepilin-type processing-associated H-X9-DG protein
LLIPAIQKIRNKAERIQCQNHLKQIGLATQNFHDTRNNLPSGTLYPSGASALVQILPFLEGENYFRLWNLNLPVLSAPNSRAAGTEIPFLLCPSDPSPGKITGAVGTRPQYGRNNYVPNLGANAWMGNVNPATGGPFFRNSKIRLTSLSDGTSKTAMFSEIKRGNPPNRNPNLDGKRVPGWFSPSPADLSPPANCYVSPPNGVTLSGLEYFRGRLVFTGYYTHSIPPNNSGPDCTNRVFDAGHHAARSYHSGGVNVLFCDGSVHFISNSINLDVWKGLGTRGGGEVISY